MDTKLQTDNSVTIGKTAYTLTRLLYPAYPATGATATKSEVWLATDPNGQEVVIKYLADQSKKDFFKKCARGTAEAAKHSKSVIRVHQYNDQYVVMDNGGESLEKKLQDKIKEPGFTVASEEWIAQVCSWGLNAAYALKSLHELDSPRYSGDAHWGNFVCDQQGIVRICDLAGSTKNLPAAYGSAAPYFHPVQEEGEIEPASAKHDLFVLCQSLALLFTAKFIPKVFHLKTKNPNLPDKVIDLIEAGRKEFIEERKYGTMNEFITAWENLITDSNVLGFEIKVLKDEKTEEQWRMVYSPLSGFRTYIDQLNTKMQGSSPGFGMKEFDELAQKFREYNEKSKDKTKLAQLLEGFVRATLIPYLQSQFQKRKTTIETKRMEYKTTREELERQVKSAKNELDLRSNGMQQEQQQITEYKTIAEQLGNPQSGLRTLVTNLSTLPPAEVQELNKFLSSYQQPDPGADLTAIMNAARKK